MLVESVRSSETMAAEIITAHLVGVCAPDLDTFACDEAFKKRDKLVVSANDETLEEVRRIGRALIRLAGGE